jgi:molecular chaperone HscB
VENPFELLGLPLRFDLSPGDVERRYRDLQRVVHPDRHAGASFGARREALSSAVSVSEAYRALRDDVLRAEALLSALGHSVDPASMKADPALLVEMMDLRESMQDARSAGDARRVEGLRARVVAERDTTLAELTRRFEARELESAATLVTRLRYYRRFLEELAGFEDEETHLGPR